MEPQVGTYEAMKCKTCGHDPEQYSKAALKRWAEMSKKERSAAMKAVRAKGLKTRQPLDS